MPGPTIFAMGGGGFLSEPADAALERYVLDLAEPVEPRICFLPTVSGDPQGSIVRLSASGPSRVRTASSAATAPGR